MQNQHETGMASSTAKLADIAATYQKWRCRAYFILDIRIQVKFQQLLDRTVTIVDEDDIFLSYSLVSASKYSEVG
jgi:hypothetical protein